MKRIFINTALFILGMVVVISLGAATEYHLREGSVSNYSDIMCVTASMDAPDINDSTTSLTALDYSTLERIVIDGNGTDTAFSVYLYDTSTDYNDVTIFSKTDCNSMEFPYSYAISQADTASNDFLGVPVFESASIYITDVNDTDDPNVTHLDALDVMVYFRRK